LWKTLHEHASEEEAELAMHFTNWVRKKLTKVLGLVQKVLARFPKKRKQLLGCDDVLLADPYASEHRRALFDFLMLGVCLAGLGCVPPSFWRNDPPPPPKVEVKPPPAPPIVTPESVNENNAAHRAHVFREEIEFDRGRKDKPVGQAN